MPKKPTRDGREVLRNQIMCALKALSTEHDWSSTEMIHKVLLMQYPGAHKYSLSKVGNNLRCLREHGVVDDLSKYGVRHWKLTGREYVPEKQVKLLIVFPESVHDLIVQYSKRGGLSKNALIVNLVATGLQSLDAVKNVPTAEV